MKRAGFILLSVFCLMTVFTITSYGATMSVSIDGISPSIEIGSVTIVWDVAEDFTLESAAATDGNAIPEKISMGWMSTLSHSGTARTLTYGNADWDFLGNFGKNPMHNGTVCSFDYSGTIEGYSDLLFFDYTGEYTYPVQLLNPDTWISEGEMRAVVPIPGTVLLFGSGLLGLMGIGRRRMKKS
jgi:hypothetical protein